MPSSGTGWMPLAQSTTTAAPAADPPRTPGSDPSTSVNMPVHSDSEEEEEEEEEEEDDEVDDDGHKDANSDLTVKDATHKVPNSEDDQGQPSPQADRNSQQTRSQGQAAGDLQQQQQEPQKAGPTDLLSSLHASTMASGWGTPPATAVPGNTTTQDGSRNVSQSNQEPKMETIPGVGYGQRRSPQDDGPIQTNTQANERWASGTGEEADPSWGQWPGQDKSAQPSGEAAQPGGDAPAVRRGGGGPAPGGWGTQAGKNDREAAYGGGAWGNQAVKDGKRDVNAATAPPKVDPVLAAARQRFGNQKLSYNEGLLHAQAKLAEIKASNAGVSKELPAFGNARASQGIQLPPANTRPGNIAQSISSPPRRAPSIVSSSSSSASSIAAGRNQPHNYGPAAMDGRKAMHSHALRVPTVPTVAQNHSPIPPAQTAVLTGQTPLNDDIVAAIREATQAAGREAMGAQKGETALAAPAPLDNAPTVQLPSLPLSTPYYTSINWNQAKGNMPLMGQLEALIQTHANNTDALVRQSYDRLTQQNRMADQYRQEDEIRSRGRASMWEQYGKGLGN